MDLRNPKNGIQYGKISLLPVKPENSGEKITKVKKKQWSKHFGARHNFMFLSIEPKDETLLFGVEGN